MRKICIIRVNVPTTYLLHLTSNDNYIEFRVELVRDERKTVGKATVGDVIVFLELISCTMTLLRCTDWRTFTPVVEQLAVEHMIGLIDSEK